MGLDILLVIGGVVGLLLGGELLVRGAASLARGLGISAMVVGLTVVAYGTSAPELVVSALAAYRDNAAICAGNIVGSNILNILFVLGVTALVCPLKAERAFVRREVPIMVVVSILFFGLAWNGDLDRGEGIGLLALLVGYSVLAVWLAKRGRAAAAMERDFEDVQDVKKRSIGIDVFLIIIGLVLLAGGSELFLRGAVNIATAFGVSEAMIGLTLVAVGTSLPELAACLVAAYRKHPDITLGNLIGSNVYNLLAIGGVASVIRPLPFEADMVRVHIPVMVAASGLLWLIIGRRMQVTRRGGALLLVAYAGYLGWLISTAR